MPSQDLILDFESSGRAPKIEICEGGEGYTKRNFSARAFQKEVNHLVKNGNKSKKKVLEALSVKKEQKKLKTIKLKKGRAAHYIMLA
jgi:hypothetical protein